MNDPLQFFVPLNYPRQKKSFKQKNPLFVFFTQNSTPMWMVEDDFLSNSTTIINLRRRYKIFNSDLFWMLFLKKNKKMNQYGIYISSLDENYFIFKISLYSNKTDHLALTVKNRKQDKIYIDQVLHTCLSHIYYLPLKNQNEYCVSLQTQGFQYDFSFVLKEISSAV